MNTSQGLDPAVPVLSGTIVAPDGTGLSTLAQAAVEAGTPANTSRAYAAAWRQFTAWCELRGRAALPATADTITEYVTYLAYEAVPGGARQPWLATGGRRGLKPSSIDAALAGLYAMHREAGVPEPSREGAKRVLRGYRAQLATAHDPRAKTRKAVAVTAPALRQLIELIDTDDMIQLRDLAMGLLGFSVAARLSELVMINIGDVRQDDRGLDVSVYRQKTRLHHDVALPSSEVPEVVRIVLLLISRLEGKGVTSGPLFQRMDKAGNIGQQVKAGRKPATPDSRVTTGQARRRLKLLGQRLGKDWTGHGLRRGFATEARINGRDNVTVAAQGGWNRDSSAMLGYFADADKWVDNGLKGMNL